MQRNRNLFLLVAVLGLCVVMGFYIKKRYYDPRQGLVRAIRRVKELSDSGKLKNGDIIFQISLSGQSKAIQLATHSPYSHCGLIFNLDTGQVWYVMEAVKTVRWTPLSKWISRGEGGHYVIKRAKMEPLIPDEMRERLKTAGEKFIGKDYDWYFDWSDDKIYCSELVWKCYYNAIGLEIGKLQQLKDLDLSNALVQTKMKERYGNNIPLNGKMITPASIFNSDMLVTVDER